MLSFEQVYKDVMLDFKRRYAPDVNIGYFYAPFASALQSIMSDKPRRVQYSICYSAIWNIYSRYCDRAQTGSANSVRLNILSDEAIIISLTITVEMFNDRKWKDELIENFAWEPDVLRQVRSDSNSILTIMKQHYYHKNIDTAVIAAVDALFERIVAAKDKLESLTYIYRPKEEIMGLYNYEVLTCRLDVEALKQHSICFSHSMREYDESLRCAAYRALWGDTSVDLSTNPYEAFETYAGRTDFKARDGFWIPEFEILNCAV